MDNRGRDDRALSGFAAAFEAADGFLVAADLGGDGFEAAAQLVDLDCQSGRTFVNNASFGAYAEVVKSAAHRDDKRSTAPRSARHA